MSHELNIKSFSHIAYIVKNIEKMIEFYEEFTEMKVTHKRIDGDVKVIWLRLLDTNSLTIVMIENPSLNVDSYQRLNHLGFDAVSKKAVDKISQKAEKAGVLKYKAQDGGIILGYFCIIQDPDGNQIEFAYGQMREN